LPGLFFRIVAVGSLRTLMGLIKVTIGTSTSITPAHGGRHDKGQRNDANDDHDYDDSCPHRRHRDHQRLAHFGVPFPGIARLGRYRGETQLLEKSGEAVGVAI
jgi:hypothetical protein